MKSRLVFGGLLVAVLGLSSIFSVPIAKATPLEPDWFGGEPIVKKVSGNYSTQRCENEVRKVSTNKTLFYQPEDYGAKTWCIYHYNGFDITFYKRWASSQLLESFDQFKLMAREESGMAISFDGGVLVPVQDTPYGMSDAIRYAPGMDKMIYAAGCEWMGCIVYESDLLHFTAKEENAQTGYYVYDSRGGDQVLIKYDSGEAILTNSFMLSDNGKWASFTIREVGLVRLNMTNLEWGLVDTLNYSVPSWFGGYVGSTGITDDGNTLMYSATLHDPVIIRYYDGCDVRIPTRLDGGSYWTNLKSTCKRKSILQQFISYIGVYDSGYVKSADYIHFRGTGDEIDMHVYSDSNNWFSIYPANTQIDSDMTYLALGDSYSSGEGDIEPGVYHYLPNTNVLGSYKDGIPRELCHVSDRSYPFLLAKDMGIVRGNDMQSIACSGAVRNDVDTVGASGYLGQPAPMANGTMPRLNGLANAADLQNAAESSFIPGRVRQIELVKKYEPKVVTIGISGNDLGFGHIVTDCILNLGFGDCQYAEDRGKKELGSAISANYDKQVALYAALKAASPGTDFYAVGYPQFITDDSFCLANADALNQAEREMIRNAVTYTNATIKHAAATAGIKYIDIEHSLDGKKMCEGSDAVVTPAKRVDYGLVTDMTFEDDGRIDSLNGVTDYIHKVAGDYYRESKESLSANPIMAAQLSMQEAFHPNAVGHQLIYDYIHNHMNGTSLLDATCDDAVIVCPLDENKNAPVEPDYFGKSDEKTDYYQMLQNAAVGGQITQAAIPMNGTVQRGAHVTVSLPNGTVSAGTSAKVVLRSEPVELSDIRAGNGGELSGDVLIPADTPVGYHSIAVTFVNGAGDSAKYIQLIFVTGPADDIDGDGVVNSSDTCEFLTPSGVDSDGDGIDDNCDLQSNQPSVSASVSVGNARGKLLADVGATTDNWATIDAGTNPTPNRATLPNLKAVAKSINATSKDDDTITESIIVRAAGVLIMLMMSLWLLAKKRKQK